MENLLLACQNRLDHLRVKSYAPFFVPMSSSSTRMHSAHLFSLIWKTH